VLDFDFVNKENLFNIVTLQLSLNFCKKLKDLTMKNCFAGVCDDLVDSCMPYLKNINFLSIDNCANFDDECLYSISEHCQENLSKLRLIGLDNITNEGYSTFFEQFRHLKELTITNSPNFSNQHLVFISKFFKNLELLELSNLENISDEGLVPYTHRFFNLQQLKIDECDNVNTEVDDSKIKNNETKVY
jgi:hypothetical protein